MTSININLLPEHGLRVLLRRYDRKIAAGIQIDEARYNEMKNKLEVSELINKMTQTAINKHRFRRNKRMSADYSGDESDYASDYESADESDEVE